MARRLGLLILLAAGSALAQTPEATPAEKSRRHGWGDRKGGSPAPMTPEFENVRKALEALTPEQRKRFSENVVRWMSLPVEEKKMLRDRDDFRRRKMSEDIDEAVKESGLTLTPEQREQYGKRYGEERRKIEEQIRRDIDEKRRPLIREMIARLKTEFSGAPTTQP